MKYLGIESSELIELGGIHTATEISQQPEIWAKVWQGIEIEQEAIRLFLEIALSDVKRIVLTGAGTSAFIGISLRGVFQRSTGILTEALATTDIVTHPHDYFNKSIPTLLISFARSGNSPESLAAASLADTLSTTCYHLIITCNSKGKLAQYASNSKRYVYALPPESNDISLAMTSSYTGMLLAGVLIARIQKFQETRFSVDKIIKYANHILKVNAAELRTIAEIDFKRAVFLGSGPFYGTAIESHLKLQELSDGRVICKNDSFLGFRHGPKVVIDETTLVVYYFSNNDYPHKYEIDLIRDMKKSTSPLIEIGVSESPVNIRLPHMISLSKEDGTNIEEELLAVCYVLPAQILGFFKSLHLGLQPDSPSSSGAITRVVQGVEIYEFTTIEK